MESSNPSGDYRIGPEDMLQITLYNVADGRDGAMTPRTLTVRVSQTGVVSLPLLGEVSVKGLTTSGLEQTLRQLYDRYIFNPQVGVLVVDYRQRVSIIGAVQKPGEFVISGPKTLIDLLAMAGGLGPNAGTQVHLYRRGPNGHESYVVDLLVLASNPGSYNDKNINQPIQSGDVVNVPQAGMFFIDGAVKNPGSYLLSRRYTLTQALAAAGGVDAELYSSDVTIFRRRGSSDFDPIAVNVNGIWAGSAVDPQIEADDVIVVPISGVKYFVKRFVGTIVSGFSISPLMFR
jgi:polysaccharide export outer membrane protein